LNPLCGKKAPNFN